MCFGDVNCVGGGSSFFLMCKDFGRMFDNLFSACTVFVVVVVRWKLAHAH